MINNNTYLHTVMLEMYNVYMDLLKSKVDGYGLWQEHMMTSFLLGSPRKEEEHVTYKSLKQA